MNSCTAYGQWAANIHIKLFIVLLPFYKPATVSLGVVMPILPLMPQLSFLEFELGSVVQATKRLKVKRQLNSFKAGENIYS